MPWSTAKSKRQTITTEKLTMTIAVASIVEDCRTAEEDRQESFASRSFSRGVGRLERRGQLLWQPLRWCWSAHGRTHCVVVCPPCGH